MTLLECIYCLLESLFELVIDNLLSPLLDEVLRIVLSHGRIYRGREANDRAWPRMAHINANQHRLHRLHGVRELHLIQVSSHLAVDLLQDVRGYGHVELSAESACYNLRRDLIQSEDLLDHLVQAFSIKHVHCNLRMTENFVRAGHHVVKQLLLELSRILL